MIATSDDTYTKLETRHNSALSSSFEKRQNIVCIHNVDPILLGKDCSPPPRSSSDPSGDKSSLGNTPMSQLLSDICRAKGLYGPRRLGSSIEFMRDINRAASKISSAFESVRRGQDAAPAKATEKIAKKRASKTKNRSIKRKPRKSSAVMRNSLKERNESVRMFPVPVARHPPRGLHLHQKVDLP